MFIEIEGLAKVFGEAEGLVVALDEISACIDEGEYLAVHGPSGSGKSTFLNIVGGLLHPSAGTVTVDGINLYEDLDSEGLARFRSEYVGFVFQAFHLMPYLTAYENVVLPLAHIGISRKKKRHMAEEALRSVGLIDRMTHLPGELSGGQQQRVAIARAIVNEPMIIIADEPTGNLDQETRGEILGLFNHLNRDGHTVIMVTHDPKNVEDACRSIYIVDGRIRDRQVCMD